MELVQLRLHGELPGNASDNNINLYKRVNNLQSKQQFTTRRKIIHLRHKLLQSRSHHWADPARLGLKN